MRFVGEGIYLPRGGLQRWFGDNKITGQQFEPDYIDIRDDRLVFYGNFKRGAEIKFYYAPRAITQGEFTLPPIAADAMYNPKWSLQLNQEGKLRLSPVKFRTTFNLEASIDDFAEQNS